MKVHSRGKRSFGLIRITLLAFAGLLRAQSPATPDGEVILRSSTRVVQIDVSVRDPQGRPVENLGRNDFAVTDNGKPRLFTIFNVARPTADAVPAQPSPSLPPNTFTNIGQAQAPSTHSTVLLLDGVNGWFDNFALARVAVLGMLKKVPADEKIALYVVGRHQGLGILQDYTLDRSLLLHAMDKFIPQWMCPTPSALAGADDGMHDANLDPGPPRAIRFGECRNQRAMQSDVDSVRISFDALAHALRDYPGRKSIFWLTQGFPPSLLRSDPVWNDTIARLNDANVEVNTVDSNGLGGPAGYWGPGGLLTMMQIAERTGGTAYYHRNDLDQALTEGIAATRTGYTLGFYLTEIDGRYHQLKVSVNRPGLQLNYRQGYNAVEESARDRSHAKPDLTEALLTPTGGSGIGIIANIRRTPGGLAASMRISPDTLSLKGGRKGRLKELFAERNAAGQIIGQQSFESRFEVSPGREKMFRERGIVVTQSLQLRPATVSLTIIVQDTESGELGSLTVPLANVVSPKDR